MRILISAGEASGDAYGGALSAELLMRDPSLDLSALGGSRVRATGAKMLGDSSTWGAISVTQALRIHPRVLRGYYRLKSELRRGKPGLFLPIDFGYANIRLARHAKNHGWNVLYFVPPPSWRRDRQGKDVADLSDGIVTPFPWSAEIFETMGAKAHFFGHPIKSLAPPAFHGERSGVALLPGSRQAEIETLLPVYAAAVRDLAQAVRIPVPESQKARVETMWRVLSGRKDDEMVTTGAWDALQRSQAAIVCSGTATLEAALARTPFSVAYRLSKATLMEAKIIRFKPPKYISLPNIILDRPIVRELLQDDANPAAIRAEIERHLANPTSQQEAFDKLDGLLGPADAIARTAELALQMSDMKSR